MGWCRSRAVVAGLVVVLFGLAVGACSDDTGPSATPLTTDSDGETTTTDQSASTSTTATTTFAQADEPPELVNTGEDFDAIVRSFVAYGEWLSVHPEPDRVSDVYREGSPGWERLHRALTDLQQNGYHTDGATPGSITETRLLERPGPDIAIVYAVIDNPPYDVVDVAGNVIEHAEGDPLRSYAFELRRQADGRWLAENRTELGVVE